MSLQVNRVDVSAVAAYPGDPQIIIPFEPRKIQLMFEGTSDGAFISFEGTADDIRLTPGIGVTLEGHSISQMFLKRDVAGVTVQVITES